MPKSVFTCVSSGGEHYEVLAECTDSVEKILESASHHYRRIMRDVIMERRLTRVEEHAAAERLGWVVSSISKRSKRIEAL